jgi:hypothetical protein
MEFVKLRRLIRLKSNNRFNLSQRPKAWIYGR